MLDATNLRILDILQQDARTSVADIARQVGRAESTVRERIATLEANRLIRGYRAIVDHGQVGQATRAMIRTSLELDRLPTIRDQLSAIPQVMRVCMTTGRRPLLVEVVTRDLSTLQRLLVQRFGPLGLTDVETEIVVDEPVERPVLLHAIDRYAPSEPDVLATETVSQLLVR